MRPDPEPTPVPFPLLLAITLLFTSPAAWADSTLGDNQSTLGRTIFVHPTGTPAENAAALTAALGSDTITGRTTPADEPVRVVLGPGEYDFGFGSPFGEGISLPDHVSLEGGGIGVTSITCDCSTAISLNGMTGQVSRLEAINSNTLSSAGIKVENAAVARIDGVQVRAVLALVVDNSTAEVTGSNLITPLDGDDALTARGGSVVTVEHSLLTGSDKSEDGIVWHDNNAGNVVELLYNSIGLGGVQAVSGGTVNCLATTQSTTFLPTGCPAVP